jgi:TRAP-type C4-dicarboxylate transport system permease small subunit
MYFRWTQGIRTETLKDCHKLMEWTHTHNFDMADIAACGKYFDPTKFEIKKLSPPSIKILSAFLCECSLVIIFASIIMIAFSNNVFTKFKSTERYFWLGAHQAQPFLPIDAPIFTKDACQPSALDIKALPGGFSEGEHKILCESFSDPEKISNFVSHSLKLQRWVLGVLIIPELLLFFFTLTHITNNISAKRLAEKIKNIRHKSSETAT